MSASKTKENKKVRSFPIILQSYREVIHSSAMFDNLCDSLKEYNHEITSVCCLAIGSFSDDFPAKYQLALLIEMIEYLEKDDKKIQVSIYDPVFTDEDKKYMSENYESWIIESEMDADKFKPESTLFFLPHAPLDLTEAVLKADKPTFLLANNIVQHTDRYTKTQLFEKYPILCKLVHFAEAESSSTNETTPTLDDGFTTFVSKKKRKQKSKYKFVEPTIDYDAIETSFKGCSFLTTFEKGTLLKDKPWVNSFSDLALHYINQSE